MTEDIHDYDFHENALIYEAADEIEALRQALKDLYDLKHVERILGLEKALTMIMRCSSKMSGHTARQRLESTYSIARDALKADTLSDEVADYVDRLLDVLRKIADHHVPGNIPDGHNTSSWTVYNYFEIREIARAALVGEKVHEK